MPVRTDIRITGIRETLTAGKKMVEEDTIRIVDGLDQCADVVLERSQEIVPRDTEALAKSGHKETEGRGLMAMSTVVYGGPEAPYAWIVHEDVTKFHEPPTRDHYLSVAVAETTARCKQIIQRQFFSHKFSVPRE